MLWFSPDRISNPIAQEPLWEALSGDIGVGEDEVELAPGVAVDPGVELGRELARRQGV